MTTTASSATDRVGLTLHLNRGPQQQPALLDARLVDCSRTEVQLEVDQPLELEEEVFIRLRDEQSGLQLDGAATVAWQQPAGEGTWSVGCQFTHELDWETLGELYLCGILESPL